MTPTFDPDSKKPDPHHPRCWRCSRLLVTASEISRDICLGCLAMIQPMSPEDFRQSMARHA